VDRPRFEETISVHLGFSHALSREQDTPKITAKPPVEKLNVHQDHATLRVSGGFEPGMRYTIKVRGTLSAENGSTLGKDKCVGSAGIGQLLSSAKRMDRWLDVGIIQSCMALVKSCV